MNISELKTVINHIEIKRRDRKFILSFYGKDFDTHNSSLIILVDDIPIEYRISPINNYEYSVKTQSFKKYHEIKIIDRMDNDRIICSLKYNVLLLFFHRIINIIKIFPKITLKLKRVLPIVIMTLWKRHKFIIPVNMWPQYLRFLKLRLNSHGDSPFYHPQNSSEYRKWLENKTEVYNYSEVVFDYSPKISIVVPVYNVNSNLLEKCIQSVLMQSYKNFELCMVDDASTSKETIEVLKKYENLEDNRIKIKFRSNNGHICVATNDCITLASGEFIGFLDNDDVLDTNACYEVVKALNKNRKLDFIYSDEDKIGLKGEYRDPHFKPDFSPDTLLSLNYITHFSVIRKSLIEKVGGFRPGYEGSQDYDLYLRIIELTNEVYHIPKILYHWRMTTNSTSLKIDNKSYALINGQKAIHEHLKRLNRDARVHIDDISHYYCVEYVFDVEPLVSIIIPTKDNHLLLDQCLKSIYTKTKYTNFEVIVANNNSINRDTYDLFQSYKLKYANFRVIDINIEFNYSRINNIAAKQANGQFLLLLNNDIKVIDEEWLKYMVGYARQSHIGAVGAKLLYSNDTIQHCGVVLGIGGVGSHVFLNASSLDTGLFGRLSVPYNYSAVTGACLLVSKEKYFSVGGLDEGLKVAYNDVDFCLKLLEKGYKNVVVPKAKLYHFESKSRGYDTTIEKYERFKSETNFMINKWNKIIFNDPMYNQNYSLDGWFVLDKKGSRSNVG